MASTITARPNHYETLGLAPGAGDDQIARAYARQVGMFGSRPVADVARASIAFETLRDPARRRAYDEELGLRAKAPPRIMSTAGRAQFIGFTPAAPVARSVHAAPVPAVASGQPRPQPPGEPRTSSFIAAALRPPAAPEPQPAAIAEAEPLPEARRSPQFEPLRRFDHPRAAEIRLADAEDSPVRLSRTVAVAGGLIGCVVLIGALLGLQAGKGEQPQAVAAGVTAALPAPKPARPAAVPGPVEPRSLIAGQPRQPAGAAAARLAAPARARQSEVPDLALAEPAPSPAVPVVDASVDRPDLEPAPVESAAALPLSNATIARTIERIGYSCGRVASTSPDDSGAAGVFTVTCTSGQSYRAAPIHGRYRFKRVGGASARR